jgi:hypothetical protein
MVHFCRNLGRPAMSKVSYDMTPLGPSLTFNIIVTSSFDVEINADVIIKKYINNVETNIIACGVKY